MMLKDVQQAIDEIKAKHEGIERVDYSYCPQAAEGYQHQIWMFLRVGYMGRAGWGADKGEFTTGGILRRADDFIEAYQQAMDAEIIDIREKYSAKIAEDFGNAPDNPQWRL
jgi:hypothetical protein